MKFLKYFLLTILVVCIFIIGFIFYKIQHPVPKYSGSEELIGLTDSVQVAFDKHGIPHIKAKNETDAYHTLGFLHARERLFQMEMLKRMASGRLSEVLGADLLKTDKFFRTLGIKTKAKQSAEQFLTSSNTPAARAAKAYIAGINTFIDQGPTPLEFEIIGMEKSHFQEEDLYLVIGFMSFGFGDGFKVDPLLSNIQYTLGNAYLEDLYLGHVPGSQTIPSYSEKMRFDSLIANVQQALSHLPEPLLEGSNGAVIGGEKSKTGNVLLENDTHIGFSQPAVWYECYLEYPGHVIYGEYIAGFPFALLGHNDFSGWGLTMFENDDVDFYVEKIDWENNTYQFGSEKRPLASKTEEIKVKDDSTVLLTIAETHHGPIINSIFDNITRETPVSVHWTFMQHPLQFLEAAYGMNHSGSISSFQRSVSLIAAPGLNVMYGDKDGNFAWWATAKLPIRPYNVNSKLFLNGFSGKHEYYGNYGFSQNPQSINPPKGYIVTANNQPDSVEGNLYPGYYRPGDRAKSLHTFLDKNKKVGVEDLKTMALQNHSYTALEVLEIALPLIENSPENQPFLSILSKWNGTHNKDEIAPSIYNNFLSFIMYETVADELGYEGFLSFATSPPMKKSYGKLLRNPESVWWDNKNTPELENRTHILNKAFTRAIDKLKQTLGEDHAQWQWAKIHSLTHPHPLGKVPALAPIFNVGPFAVDGGNEVVNNLKFKLDTLGHFNVTGGSAVRTLLDFSDLSVSWNILPTGQSGHIGSPYYEDQAELFANGKWRAQYMNVETFKDESQFLLLLPKE